MAGNVLCMNFYNHLPCERGLDGFIDSRWGMGYEAKNLSNHY